MTTEIAYYKFWPGFYHNPSTALKQFFESVLPHGQYDLHSVFSNGLKNNKDDRSRIQVHFSGEPFSDNPREFDLNLVMEEDDKEKHIVFCPLFSIGSYEHGYWPLYWTPRPLSMKQKTHFCAFVVSNPNAHTRNKFFDKLNRYKKVDSCGSAMNNCGYTAPRDGYFNFLQRYKFMICFENTSKPFYITEKLHNAYLGGTIPIYWGCCNAKTWLNPQSFLYLEDESDEAMERLVQKIIELDQDDTLYQSMHQQLLLSNARIPEIMTIETMSSKVADVLSEYKDSKQP